MRKITDETSGEEIEVYTADEVKAQLAEKDTEFGKTRTQIETERDEARKALGERTSEFKQFRKLSDEAVAKLSITERALYDNQVLLQEEKEKNLAGEKQRIDSQVDVAIRAKAGTDEKLIGEMKKMYDIVAIDAKTPEEIERKTLIVLGALGQVQPDLVASVAGFSSGGYIPPVTTSTEPTFAQTETGKSLASELGLITEPPKKS